MQNSSRRKTSEDVVGWQEGIGQQHPGNGHALMDIENRKLISPQNGTGARTSSSSSLLRDLPSIALLLVLYTLQGIPMGLSGSIPFLLVEKVSYSDQALFSLVSLPFSLKLLWAPLVDSMYWDSFGRRKSWLVPAQLLCGGMMLWARGVMDVWVGENGEPPHIKTLTAYFLALYFIMATQDIAVDGWALTMLSQENIGYGSTCNTIGQTLGFLISQVGFLAFNNADVCNKYLRSEPSDVGMVTLSTFLQFWGVVFLATTVFVCFFKTEAHHGINDKVLGLVDTYKQLIQCVRLPSVQSLAMVLLTCRIAFAVTDAATTLKLVEYGMPREEIAMLSPLLLILGMIVPVAVGRMTAGPKPMSVFLWGYPLRLAVTILYMWVLLMSREAHMPGARKGIFFTCVIVAVFLHEVASNCMFVAQMGFFSRISDPVIGGSYMTLLNTIANVGTKWPNSLSLYMLDLLTIRGCVGKLGEAIFEASCRKEDGEGSCANMGGSCVVQWDGYFVQAVICTIIGVGWFCLFRRRILNLQHLRRQEWIVSSETKFD